MRKDAVGLLNGDRVVLGSYLYFEAHKRDDVPMLNGALGFFARQFASLVKQPWLH